MSRSFGEMWETCTQRQGKILVAFLSFYPSLLLLTEKEPAYWGKSSFLSGFLKNARRHKTSSKSVRSLNFFNVHILLSCNVKCIKVIKQIFERLLPVFIFKWIPASQFKYSQEMKLYLKSILLFFIVVWHSKWSLMSEWLFWRLTAHPELDNLYATAKCWERRWCWVLKSFPPTPKAKILGRKASWFHF